MRCHVFKQSACFLILYLIATGQVTAATLAVKSARFRDGVLTVAGSYRGEPSADNGMAYLFDKQLDRLLASLSLADILPQKKRRRFLFSLTGLTDVPCAVRVVAAGAREKKLKVKGAPRNACSLGTDPTQTPSENPNGSGDPPSAGEGLAGSIWYQWEGELIRINAATGVKQSIARRQNYDAVLAPFPAGQRYLETFNRGGTTDVTTTIQVYEVGAKNLVGEYSVNGYGVLYRGSWDGRYVSFTWSPEYYDTIRDEPRIDLAILDFGDPANPRFVRIANVEDNVGPSAIVSHAWLPDGRYVYLREDLQIVVGHPGTGESGEQIIGTLDTQGQVFAGWDISPDGASFLVSLRDPNGRLASTGGDHNIFLTTLAGQMLGRLTVNDFSVDPRWSPDGRSFLFKQDAGFTCQGGGCIGECDVQYAGTDQRDVGEGVNLRPGNEFIPCQSSDLYWTR